MPYTLPSFDLTVNQWRAAAGFPPVGPPAASPPANLAWGRRVAVPSTGGTGTLGVVLMTMTLLVPTGVHVVCDRNLTAADSFEVPAGSGRFYRAAFADYIGLGFSNEHIGVVLVQAGDGIGT